MKLDEHEEHEISNSLDNTFGLNRLPGEDLKSMISRAINTLIVHDFNQLVTILYRLDISEKKLNGVLGSNPGKDAGDLISDLVIERELEKFKSRQQFRRNDPIADDDKW